MLLTVVLGGCGTLGYYGQALHGGAALLLARQPISAVAADPAVSVRTRQGLQLVTAARRFARDELQLPVAGEFDTYVDLRREYAVWNVYAAPPLALELHRWCYPIAGCAVYRGYFSEGDARAYGEQLSAQGWDVYVGGVIAYSTLGWFDDPVLNTFVGYGDFDLLGLIFHELAHSRVYVPGDSRFNESFATFVEEAGVERWFALHPSPVRLAAYHHERKLRGEFLAFMHQQRAQFEALYRADLTVAEKLRRKAELITAMRAAYHAAATSFRGRYDLFFGRDFNNARLATLTTYHDWVPAFRALRVKVSNWAAFYLAVEALGRLPMVQREQRLRELAPDHAPELTQ